MDWFQRWPKDALIAVANHFLSKFDIVCTEEVKKQVIQTMGTTHDGVAESCVDYFQRYRRFVTANQRWPAVHVCKDSRGLRHSCKLRAIELLPSDRIICEQLNKTSQWWCYLWCWLLLILIVWFLLLVMDVLLNEAVHSKAFLIFLQVNSCYTKVLLVVPRWLQRYLHFEEDRDLWSGAAHEHRFVLACRMQIMAMKIIVMKQVLSVVLGENIVSLPFKILRAFFRKFKESRYVIHIRVHYASVGGNLNFYSWFQMHQCWSPTISSENGDTSTTYKYIVLWEFLYYMYNIDIILACVDNTECLQ